MSELSLSQQAYEGIKRQIITLDLPPGSVIDEAGLQRQLALGRTPIREALKRLSLEKLVVIAPRRGMFVADIRIKDLQRLFEVRLALETLACRLAAGRGTAEQWQRMRRALARLPDADTTANEALIAVDEACHEIIYQATDNEFLHDALATHYALSLRLWYYFLPRLADMHHAVLEHRRILQALESGDGPAAAGLMEKHIRAFQEELQAVMLGVPDGNGRAREEGEMR